MILTGLAGTLVIVPMISNIPLIELIGYKGCMLFSTTISAYNWQKLTSGFGMAYYRFLCIKKNTLVSQVGSKKILKAILCGQFILIFFGVILSVVRDMTRKRIKFGYCEEVPSDFYHIKMDYEGLLIISLCILYHHYILCT